MSIASLGLTSHSVLNLSTSLVYVLKLENGNRTQRGGLKNAREQHN
jgi:hypothetical protein